MSEIWKDVPGYEGYYQVSNYGRAKRIKPHNGHAGILKPQRTANGYLKYSFCVNGKIKQLAAHRLVLLAFVGPCPNGLCVNHKDGNRENNRWDNLEYATNSENMIHAHIMLGASPAKGEDHVRAVVSRGDVREMRRLYASGNYTQKELGNRYGIGRQAVGKIVNGRRWKHVE